jgi:hypothetical protein
MSIVRSIALAGVLAISASPIVASEGNRAEGGKTVVSPPRMTAKLGVSKADLGVVTRERTINGTLDRGDGELADGTFAEMHTATFSRGQRIVVRMTSSEFDPYLLLARWTGGEVEVLAEADDISSRDLNAELVYEISEPGEYIIVANGSMPSDLGRYALSVTTEPPVVEAIQRPADYRSEPVWSRSGRLDPTDDDRLADDSLYEFVPFRIDERGVYVISLESVDFDTYLTIMDMNSESPLRLCDDDDSGAGTNSLARVELHPGDYLAVINAYNPAEHGRYRFSIDVVRAADESMPSVDWARRYPGGGSPTESYALLVGIDDYPGDESDLSSCVIDTNAMREVLISHFGFRPENIVVINDADATREHVIEAFRRHLGQAGAGGVALFYFSGHGGQCDNVGARDHETDGMDEFIAVWDTGREGSLILDEELGTLISQLRCQRRVVILDSCHSGTGTLATMTPKWLDEDHPWRAKWLNMPDAFIEIELLTNRDESLLVDGPVDHILLAAARSDESAWPGYDGLPSVFTYFLINEIKSHGADRSFVALIDGVRAAIAAESPNQVAIQTPQVEGSQKNRRVTDMLGRLH